MLQYYRSGSTYLDDKLFVRAEHDSINIPFYSNRSNESAASICDHIVAEIMANEMVWKYLTQAINNSNAEKEENRHNSKLKWTASKTGLVEWLYSLYAKGCFNHGQAELKEIATVFQESFGIDLGNYYRTFQEIRIRKVRASFIQECLDGVIEYMDETDLNYKR